MDKADKIIGKLLKEIRKSKKMSLEQVGNHFHVSKMSISYYENGKRSIPAQLLLDMLEFYNYDADEFCHIAIKEIKK